MIQFTVPGPPVPQSRPRVFRNGGVKTDSDKVANYKQHVQWCAPAKKLDGPLRLQVCAYLPRPKKEKSSGYHSKRPDLDNIVKAILDALNGKIFADDGQVAEIVARKMTDETPRTVIRIEELTH